MLRVACKQRRRTACQLPSDRPSAAPPSRHAYVASRAPNCAPTCRDQQVCVQLRRHRPRRACGGTGSIAAAQWVLPRLMWRPAAAWPPPDRRVWPCQNLPFTRPFKQSITRRVQESCVRAPVSFVSRLGSTGYTSVTSWPPGARCRAHAAAQSSRMVGCSAQLRGRWGQGGLLQGSDAAQGVSQVASAGDEHQVSAPCCLVTNSWHHCQATCACVAVRPTGMCSRSQSQRGQRGPGTRKSRLGVGECGGRGVNETMRVLLGVGELEHPCPTATESIHPATPPSAAARGTTTTRRCAPMLPQPHLPRTAPTPPPAAPSCRRGGAPRRAPRSLTGRGPPRPRPRAPPSARHTRARSRGPANAAARAVKSACATLIRTGVVNGMWGAPSQSHLTGPVAAVPAAGSHGPVAPTVRRCRHRARAPCRPSPPGPLSLSGA